LGGQAVEREEVPEIGTVKIPVESGKRFPK